LNSCFPICVYVFCVLFCFYSFIYFVCAFILTKNI
jgi:hypothetical protein